MYRTVMSLPLRLAINRHAELLLAFPMEVSLSLVAYYFASHEWKQLHRVIVQYDDLTKVRYEIIILTKQAQVIRMPNNH